MPGAGAGDCSSPEQSPALPKNVSKRREMGSRGDFNQGGAFSLQGESSISFFLSFIPAVLAPRRPSPSSSSSGRVETISYTSSGKSESQRLFWSLQRTSPHVFRIVSRFVPDVLSRGMGQAISAAVSPPLRPINRDRARNP